MKDSSCPGRETRTTMMRRSGLRSPHPSFELALPLATLQLVRAREQVLQHLEAVERENRELEPGHVRFGVDTCHHRRKLVFGPASRQAKTSGHFISDLEALEHGAASLNREPAQRPVHRAIGHCFEANPEGGAAPPQMAALLVVSSRHGPSSRHPRSWLTGIRQQRFTDLAN